MCGRYYIAPDEEEEDWEEIIAILQRRGETVKTGEIFPSDTVPVIANSRSMRPTPFAMRWGYLLPNGKRVINARSETVTEKPMFRRDFFERRCLLPASGFYEWSPEKRKYLFSRPDGKPVFLGGFYKKQSDKKAFIILTKEATAPVSRFHNRIPILIDEANIEDWLGDIDFAFHYVQTDYPSALVFHS